MHTFTKDSIYLLPSVTGLCLRKEACLLRECLYLAVTDTDAAYFVLSRVAPSLLFSQLCVRLPQPQVIIIL